METSARAAVSFLENLLRTYSPSGREDRISRLLALRMRAFGLRNVRVDEVHNVIAEVGSGDPVILLAGHMDTVPGRIPLRSTDNAVWGRGAVDAKSSLASMIIAASRLARAKIDGTIVVGALADEEGDSTGIKQLLLAGPSIDYGIFGEPSGIDNLTIGYKGSMDLRLSCRTSSGHASAPQLAKNAITELVKVYSAIENHTRTLAQGSSYHSVSTCLTQIRGGLAHNVVPDECSMTVNIRLPPSVGIDHVVSGIEAILDGYRSSDLELGFYVDGVTPPFETDKTSSLVRAFVRAHLQLRGKRPKFLKKTGTGDMNLLGHSRKIPVITYGPGEASLAHTPNEHILVHEYLASIDLYQSAIVNLLDLEAKT